MPGRILFTSHTADFAKFNQPLIQMLQGKGYEVHYASADEKKIANVDRNFRVDFSRSPIMLNQHVRAYCQIKKIINEGNYDLVHTHTPVGSVLTRLAARQARKRGLRVLYTAHGFHFYTGASPLSWVLWFTIEKSCARLTDGLVTINREDFERAKKHFKTKPFLIPGVGVDPSKFRVKMNATEKRNLRSELKLKPDDFVMINAAELNSNKNQRFIIEVLPEILKKRPNAHVLFAGDDCLSGSLQKFADQCGVAQNVHFLGYRGDLPQLFAISNLAVSASKREGLGINLLEAIAAGLPVLASNNRGHREILAQSQLFQNNNPVDFMKKFNLVLSKPTLTFPDKFSAVNSLLAMDKIYRDILGPQYEK
ncbi:glycosyltransferase [Candidatus Saccharibacteria bacterium]|nr:glycosyltransferase [Candidatus Saccharibacteria bacterium]